MGSSGSNSSSLLLLAQPMVLNEWSTNQMSVENGDKRRMMCNYKVQPH